MSAAAARRRKQLIARQNEQDVVGTQLKVLLLDNEESMTEEQAYEALQVAQSSIRRKVKEGKFQDACNLAYSTSLALLKKGRVSVASQLLTLLTGTLRETHTVETEDWITRLIELHVTHTKAMDDMPHGVEAIRLKRLQRVWLASALQWSSELGQIRYGSNKLQEILGEHCWNLSHLVEPTITGEEEVRGGGGGGDDIIIDDDDEENEMADLQCDAVQYMALAEKPETIITWLKALPSPAPEETTANHSCPPALRDALLTRVTLLLCALENLRDATKLLHSFIADVEDRNIQDLVDSYTKKDSGKAPSHIVFCSMLVRICEKDTRTGPLYQWAIRSFKKELDKFHKPQEIVSYTTKIGKLYFGIQPPPSMLNMMENMMGGMGGGGMGGGMNPAMMQAALAQLQGM
jgi:Golgi to ER traffic protein 4